MIKPMIHRLWLGPNKIPDEYVAYGLKWQELNPIWQVMNWNFQMLSFLQMKNIEVIHDIWDRGGNSIEAAVQVADVVGYELIYHYGGIYVNVDIEPIRSLDYMFDYYQINEDRDAYAGREDWNTPRIVNAVLGGPPKHPFWEYVIVALAPRYFANPEAEMVETTGPALLTDCVNVWNNTVFDEKIHVLNHKAFNLVHWSRIPLGENADGRWIDSEEVVGVHHWGHRKTGRTNIVGVI